MSDALTEDDDEDPKTEDITRKALDNVKKIFENLQQEGGREKAVE